MEIRNQEIDLQKPLHLLFLDEKYRNHKTLFQPRVHIFTWSFVSWYFLGPSFHYFLALCFFFPGEIKKRLMAQVKRKPRDHRTPFLILGLVGKILSDFSQSKMRNRRCPKTM